MCNEASKKTKKNKSAIFGVLEIRSQDDLIHMHWLARNLDVHYLLDHICKFNRKSETQFQLKYYYNIVKIESISAYPFKFGYDEKVIFAKGALKRHVFHCGNYFLGSKKKLERDGLRKFVLQKKYQEKLI
jgi:hypothetical protein